MPDAKPNPLDRACPHEDFDAVVDVGRIVRSDDDPTVIAFMAEITVACKQCGEPFRWTGVPAGMGHGKPHCNVDETRLLAPIRPASSDPDFGLGLPGYAVRYREMPDGG